MFFAHILKLGLQILNQKSCQTSINVKVNKTLKLKFGAKISEIISVNLTVQNDGKLSK